MLRPIELLFLIASLAIPEALSAQPKPSGWPLGARIPAISGQVVDAITDKPVANVDVTLRATAVTGSFFGSGKTSLRYENNRTLAEGRFSFPTSLEPEAANPLTAIKGCWLTINRTFWSIESMKTDHPYDEITSDTTADDLSWDITGDPLFNRKVTRAFAYHMAGPRVNNKAYFPMAVQFSHPCQQLWNANCIYFDHTQNLRVPLIPVLANPEACATISDEAIAEQCRQLNTYRAAFRQVETIAQVRADKELCRKVDQGPGTKMCLESLAAYIQSPDRFENRLPLQMETEIDPIEKVLILRPIAGMLVNRTTLSSLNPFRETACYSACYRTAAEPLAETSCVSVWWVPPEEVSRYASTVGPALTEGAKRVEVVEGNRIIMRDLANAYIAVWPSGTKVVEVTFYRATSHAGLGERRARAAEASPEMRRELLRQYLLKYPSSE